MRKIALITIASFIFVLSLCAGASALNENAPGLGFLPSNSPIVMAVDIDEVMNYAHSVGNTWRDADKAHFMDALGQLTLLMPTDQGGPDMMPFLQALAGVQVVSFDPSTNNAILVLTAGSTTRSDMLVSHAAAVLVGSDYRHAVEKINNALSSYGSRTVTDPETGEDTYPYDYPESLDVLIEQGYLDEIPMNPYTGQKMRIMPADTTESLGNIAYEPAADIYATPEVADESGTTPEKIVYTSYKLKAWQVDGVLTMTSYYSKDFEPYSDASRRILALGRAGFDKMGFTVEEAGGWKYLTYTRGNQAFASGGRSLLMSKELAPLKEAVSRSEKGEGFHFSSPKAFKTEGAFYRDQTDLTNFESIISKQVGDAMRMSMAAMGRNPETADSTTVDESQAIDNLMKGIGFEALASQHSAMWLRNGEIELVKHLELTGKGQGTLIGSMVYSSPKKLMTATGGPFDIIGEGAWANPGEYSKAAMDFGLEFVAPFVAEQMGMPSVDPTPILQFLGIGNVDVSKLSQEVYVMATSSTKRYDDVYLPGVTVAIHTEGEDLHYILSGLLDSAALMIPDFPMVATDHGDANAQTWNVKDNYLPFTPTIAWTDGWVVESLWREDALAARDALANGTLLRPGKMGTANIRMTCNRQKLLRGIGDSLYEMPEGELAIGGAITEILALLSGKDEGLLVEMANGDKFTESRCKFSIDLFENLVPALSYIAKGAKGWH
jgi:hypothetical protein